MQKLLSIFLLTGALIFLQGNLANAQSDDNIKLTRAEKAKKYPTTFGNRYFVTPSAIPQEKGKFSLHNTEILFVSASYGLTKHVSLGTGFNVGSLFNDFIFASPFLTAKVGFEIAPNLYVGGGVLALNDEFNGINLVGYGAVTLGDRNANITLTYSYDFTGKLTESNFDIRNDSRVLSPLSISGMYRLNKFVALVSENHFPNNRNGNLLNFIGFEGIRLIFKKSAIDLGVAGFENEFSSFNRQDERFTEFYWFPFLGYTFAF